MNILAPTISNTNAVGIFNTSIVGRSIFHALLEQDLNNAFFNSNEFAETVQYIHITGESTTYKILHFTPGIMVDVNSNQQIASSDTKIRIQSSKLLRQPLRGDKIILRGILYTADNEEDDGHGTTTIQLNKYNK